MNLRGLVSVSGKPGLFKLIGQNKSGFVLESLDAQKVKLVVNVSTSKMASLEDITIFGEDEDLKLIDIFERIKESKNIPDAKADGKVLRSFFHEVAPSHDEEKVYASDMKKIINWFNIVKDLAIFNEEAPEPLENNTESGALTVDAAKKVAPVAEKGSKKPMAAHKAATRVSQKSK